jgi:hypothetical protein
MEGSRKVFYVLAASMQADDFVVSRPYFRLHLSESVLVGDASYLIRGQSRFSSYLGMAFSLLEQP